MEEIIEVKNLIKTYKSFTAVDNISFEVYKGEIFGLLGPNGAGKTTTLEIIETIKQPTSGEVLVGNYSIKNQKDKIKQIIGIQLQQSGFYPGLTLEQILTLFADIYNIDISAIELLEKFNLVDKKNSFYKNLSGGQKQRFSLCTTLINNPKVIFLDEPTTGLDPLSRRNLWNLIKQIRKNGVTVVLTTHYMDEAEELCDRVAIIDKGKIKKIDTPENLIIDLVKKGFKRARKLNDANLEDVFLDLTGHAFEN